MSAWWSSRRRTSGHEIMPEDIFFDATNRPALDALQFEGRIERPVSVRAIAAVGSASRFSYDGAASVFDELARATAGGIADYSGMSYARLDREDGLYWPCPSPDHRGTPRLFEKSFPTTTGRARFHPTPHRDPDERCD